MKQEQVMRTKWFLFTLVCLIVIASGPANSQVYTDTLRLYPVVPSQFLFNQGGVDKIRMGEPFYFDIYWDFKPVPADSMLGGGFTLAINSPNLTSISKVNAPTGTGRAVLPAPYNNVALKNGFNTETLWALFGKPSDWPYAFKTDDFDGSLPDYFGHSFATSVGFPATTAPTAYYELHYQINQPGTICIDSVWLNDPSFDWAFGNDVGADIYAIAQGHPWCWEAADPNAPTNQPPELGAIGNRSVAEGATLQFTVTATDPDSDPLTFSASPLPANATLTPINTTSASFSFTPDFTQSGSYPIWFKVVDDEAAADSELVTITVTNTNRPPVLAAIGDKSVDEGDTLSFLISGTDPDGNNLLFTFEPAPLQNATLTNHNNGTATFTFTPNFNQSGSIPLYFIVSDIIAGSLSDSELVTITVNNVNRPPVLNPIGPKTVAKLENLNFDVTASDPDSDPLQLLVDNLPLNATFTDNGDGTGNFDFTPDESQVGDHMVTFSVFDGTETAFEIVTITVTDVNDPPVLAPIGNKSVDEGAQLLFLITASDPNGTIPILSASTLPPNASFFDSANGTGLFVFWPEFNQSGTYDITFYASDGFFVDSEMIQITVVDIPRPPVISIFPDSSVFNVYEGALLNFEVSAIDPDGTIPFLSAENLPPNAIFEDSGFGEVIFYFWPDFDQAGLYDVTFIATDGVLSDTAYVTINVLDATPPETTLLVSPSVFDIEVYEGAPIMNRAMVVYEMNGYHIQYSASNSGGWLTFNTTWPRITPDSVIFSVNPFGLAPGDYIDTIWVAAPAAVNSPVAVPVMLRINSAPPSYEDSVWIATVPATTGSSVIVPVYFKNNELLSGVQMPFQWNSNQVTLDSITFDGTRVGYVDTKPVAIDNANHRAQFGVFTIFTPFINPGRGLLAKLHFSVSASATTSFVKIDSTTIMMNHLVFTDTTGMSINPTFIYGGIVIDSISGYVCGRVIDVYGNEIEGATVELWNHFPAGYVMATAMSDFNGQFACNSLSIFPFDAYAYKPGYYPGLVKDIEYGNIGFDIVLTPIPPVTPTPEWVNFYCDMNSYYNVPLPVGSVVDAYDPDGILCGSYFVTEAGRYGLMPVYRDDPYSEDDEGADPGDTISFFVNGYPAAATGNRVWTENGDSWQVCLDVASVEDRIIVLRSGWNLISWNVDTPMDDLEALLAPIAGCIEVVLGFEQGGFTYDPALTDFSTLWNMDHFHGYWVKMTCEDTLVITGVPVAPTTPIALEYGWNLVSYLPDTVYPTPEALASVHDHLIVALGFDGVGRTYDPNLPNYSDLLEMKPGFGYWLKVTQDEMLIYPGIGPKVVFDQTFAQINRASKPNNLSVSSLWMSIYSKSLTLDGQIVPSGTDLLAIAPDGRIVGAGTVGADGKFGFVSVYGDDPTTPERDGLAAGEKFRIKIGGIESDELFAWSEAGARVEISSLTSKSGSILPTGFYLGQNYPNPFNPTTTISFSLPAGGYATLDVYNILGRKVITLFDGMAQAGENQVVWEGIDADGNPVASGIYFYKLKTSAFEQTRKMVLMK
jgi:hypothetical protein